MSDHPDFDKPTPESIVKYVKRNQAKAKASQKMKMVRGGRSDTIREADYKGHHIVIRTTYSVTVDGVPVTGALGVSNTGQVHYHAVPNLSFGSAVDLVKTLIDVFPDDFSKTRAKGKGTMPGMHMAGMGISRKRKTK